MHQPIRDHLEDYLKGAGRSIPQEFRAHLEGCPDCARDLRLLEQQSRTLRTLASADAEPRAGFYARVMERIEAQQTSIWALFLERKFGLRVAIASATLAVLLGAYLVSTEPGGMLSSTPSVVLTDAPVADAGLQPDAVEQRQRDAVLVDLASFHE